MSEVVRAFFGCEEVADVAEGFDQVVEGSGADAAQELLEFGEGHLDRFQVRGVGRQIEEPAASVPEGLCGAGVPVGAEIVQNDDAAGFEGRASWVST